MGTRACDTVQRQLQMGRDGREFADGRERAVFEKAEGYKNRTWLGSRPGPTLSLLHSMLAFFKPACSKSPNGPSLSWQSHYIALHLFVCQWEQRIVWVCVPGACPCLLLYAEHIFVFKVALTVVFITDSFIPLTFEYSVYIMWENNDDNAVANYNLIVLLNS